jgi:hypothetical protein
MTGCNDRNGSDPELPDRPDVGHSSTADAGSDGPRLAVLIFLIRPGIMILRASSGSGRWSALASSQGARIQTSRSSSAVRITGIAWDGLASRRRLPRRSESLDLMQSRDWLRFRATVALEGGPDPGKRE